MSTIRILRSTCDKSYPSGPLPVYWEAETDHGAVVSFRQRNDWATMTLSDPAGAALQKREAPVDSDDIEAIAAAFGIEIVEDA